VPSEWEDRFRFLHNKDRRKYAAMVAYMDDALGQIVNKLIEKRMWGNTLMVVSSDNGGPTYYIPKIGYGGASNQPLKGGKMSDWEGGVRVNAFVAGGAVPESKRGTVWNDYIHVADWFATFCAIAGVSSFDDRAAKADLPPVDGIDHSSLLIGKAMFGTGNRTEIHHSVRALTQGRWKLITGGYMDELARFPMGTPMIGFSDYGNGWGFQAVRNSYLAFKNCGAGCLYDVIADPTEHHNKAAEEPEVVERLKTRLDELNKGKFLPDRGTPDKNSCTRWDGFYGPWIDIPSKSFDADVVLI
jgi:arylsulfatase I/J